MYIPFYIARRYIKSGSKHTAINLISRIASIGIVLGTAALFIVLSVFSGLRTYSLSYVNDFDPDLKVVPVKGKVLRLREIDSGKLNQISGIKAISHVLEERCVFAFDGKEHIAFLKGVDVSYAEVNAIEPNLMAGYWLEPDTYQAVLGIGIVSKLSTGLQDQRGGVEVFVPKPGKGSIQRPEDAFRTEIVAPVGVYNLTEELNYQYVFVNLGLAQELMNYKSDECSALEIQLTQSSEERKVRQALHDIFGDEVVIKNRMELNESLLRMLNTENLMLYLIFTLILIVTLFTLVGALIMTIIDKKGQLKTLISIGMTQAQIQRIFFWQGALVCLRGWFFGLAFGGLVVAIQIWFEPFMITPYMPYPVEFTFGNIISVTLTIFILGMLSSALASRRVKAVMG